MEKKLVFCLVFFLTVGVVSRNVYRSYRDITVTEVCIDSSKVENAFQYLFISDLHENEFGDENERMYEVIRRLNPDFILVGGDTVNWTSENDEFAMRVIRELASIADVYFFLGNHEIEYMHFRGEIFLTSKLRDDSAILLPEMGEGGFINRLKAAGAVVLQKDWKDIEINGTKIRIGGAYEAMFSRGRTQSEETMLEGMYDFLSEYQNTDAVKLYVTHRPYCYLQGDASVLWNIDIVMSGHEHGGQVVFPVLGGLFSRERGMFPGKTRGAYLIGNTTFINSSGLGSNLELLPRFNNPPEIVMIRIR